MKKVIACVFLAAMMLVSAAFAPSIDYGAVASFGERLLSEVRASGEENPIVSPISAYTALCMAYAGADGKTADEFEALLGVSGGEANGLCAAIRQKLAGIGGNTTMNAADSIWIDDKVDLEQSYLELLIKYYDAEVLRKNLQAEGVVDDVNGWIEEKTNGLIPSMLDSIDENALLLLIDTIYMDAKWQLPFEYGNTWQDVFNAPDGEVETDFMHDTYYDCAYIDDGQYEGITLPYDDGKLAFMAVKPKEGGPFEAELTGGGLADWLSSTKHAKEVILTLPKIDVEYDVDLAGALRNMGLNEAFDPNMADFSKMGASDEGNICISKVLQNVKMRVDEEGTEAAAATVIDMVAGAAPPDGELPVELIFDSPFAYAVIDVETGVPLFMGILDRPVEAA